MQRILYIEDNDDNIYVLEGRLRRRGYQVLIARDGESGVAMARSEQPDLIVMDLVLPGIDGWEATRQLKADPVTRAIPVVALSASAMNEDRRRALDIGCADFDTKPVDFARLLRKIHTLLPPEAPQ